MSVILSKPSEIHDHQRQRTRLLHARLANKTNMVLQLLKSRVAVYVQRRPLYPAETLQMERVL